MNQFNIDRLDDNITYMAQLFSIVEMADMHCTLHNAHGDIGHTMNVSEQVLDGTSNVYNYTSLFTRKVKFQPIEHYLLDCDQYYGERLKLFIEITQVIRYPPRLTVKLILGGEEFPLKVNKEITRALGAYIRGTNKADDI